MKRLKPEKEEVVYRVRQKVEAVECDICKRRIEPTLYRKLESQYFEVITGHNDWGNDSCESRQHFDICPACIGDFITKYAKEARGSEYIEVETTYVSAHEYVYSDD